MKNLHWFVATLLALLLVPMFHVTHLPLRFEWSTYLITFYWSLFFQSLVLSIILFAIGYPSEFWRAVSGKVGPRVNIVPTITSVALPATYMFFVLILTFSYNDVIATLRFDGYFDMILNRMDSWLIGGQTVAYFSRRVWPSGFKWLEAIYFGMFPQIGACLFLVALREGRSRAMQFIGAIATAYFIGLACFYFVPATGPYYLSALHPDGGYVSASGMSFTQTLKAMLDHRPPAIIGTDYFVAFPCLHLSQPLIVLWFMRSSKRIAAALLALDLAIIPAIILLQQHYLVDLIGGACVALLAVALVDWPGLSGLPPWQFSEAVIFKNVKPTSQLEKPALCAEKDCEIGAISPICTARVHQT